MGGLFAHILQKYNKREKGMAAVLMPYEKFPHIRAMMDYAEIIAKENGVASGDLILVTGGKPGLIGDTSYLELVRVK